MKIDWSFIEPVRDQAARLRGDFTAQSEIVKLAEQQAHIERLREAVRNAYYEGWQDRESIVATEDQMHSDWMCSEARAAILGKVKAEAACPEPDEAP